MNQPIRGRRRKARLGLDEPLVDERNFLKITARIAARRQSGLLKLRRHVVRGHLVARASRVPPLQLVAGQILHVPPPALSFGRRNSGGRQHGGDATKKTLHVFGLRSVIVGAAHVVTATLAHQLALGLVQLLAADRAVEHRLFGGFLNGGRFGLQTPIIIKVSLCTGSGRSTCWRGAPWRQARCGRSSAGVSSLRSCKPPEDYAARSPAAPRTVRKPACACII